MIKNHLSQFLIFELKPFKYKKGHRYQGVRKYMFLRNGIFFKPPFPAMSGCPFTEEDL
jgi:hypothetical protein